jgi:hypothetical protein
LRRFNGEELKHRSAATCPQDIGDSAALERRFEEQAPGAPLIKDERPGADLQSITAGNASKQKDTKRPT